MDNTRIEEVKVKNEQEDQTEDFEAKDMLQFKTESGDFSEVKTEDEELFEEKIEGEKFQEKNKVDDCIPFVCTGIIKYEEPTAEVLLNKPSCSTEQVYEPEIGLTEPRPSTSSGEFVLVEPQPSISASKSGFSVSVSPSPKRRKLGKNPDVIDTGREMLETENKIGLIFSEFVEMFKSELEMKKQLLESVKKLAVALNKKV